MDRRWGAQTDSAVRHFAIGGERMPLPLLRALAAIKSAAAAVNGRTGRLPPAVAQAIEAAADEVAAGQHDAQFPLAVWQSGSGTQSNMNVNEVVAALATERLARHGEGGAAVHPNDDVNKSQSSNDTVPAAMHLSVLLDVQQGLLPALQALAAAIEAKSAGWQGLVKLGRTHLQDAVPMTLGQEAGAWAAQLRSAGTAIEASLPALHELALGGTAVGTGLNAPPGFADAVCAELARRTGLALKPAADRFAALAGHEPLLAFHGALKTLAVALMTVANNVRLLGSGPRGGLGELRLPANEPGSSIMPGKVNPTQCESLNMVAIQVIANDTAVTLGAGAGHLQLNTCKPLIAHNVLRSLRLLADAMRSFRQHCIDGLEAEPARLAELMERSLMLVTALAPHIGYDRAAAIAKAAHASGGTLREAALAHGVAASDFDAWVRPAEMARASY